MIPIDCLADCLTKSSADAKYLIKAINIGCLPHVDKHPFFREPMEGRHKACESVAHRIVDNIDLAPEVNYFLGSLVGPEIQKCPAVAEWYNEDC